MILLTNFVNPPVCVCVGGGAQRYKIDFFLLIISFWTCLQLWWYIRIIVVICELFVADPMVKQPHFTLSKWTSSNDGKCCVGGVKVDEEELQKKSTSPQLRRRGPSQFSGIYFTFQQARLLLRKYKVLFMLTKEGQESTQYQRESNSVVPT